VARSEHDPWPAAPWAWAGAGVLAGLLVAIALFAPARWLAAGVSRASAGHVVLDDPQGTVWSGSARLLLAGGAGSNDLAGLPGRLDWRIRPSWGGVRAELDAACCTAAPLVLQFRPRWHGGTLLVADQRLNWPAAVLAGLGTPWNTLQPEGDLLLSTKGLSVEWNEGRLVVAGGAELIASQVSSRLSTLKPMGSYRITLVGGPTSTLQLETVDGALQLTGSGQWIGSRLRFTGTATAAPDREAALSNLLNIIGRRSGARSIITIG
jgi:general secretion pathway protein N